MPKLSTEEQITKFAKDTDIEGVEDPSSETGMFEPEYRVLTSEHIPVNKKMGMLWKSRFDVATSRLANLGIYKRWDEAVRYYRNDHSPNTNDIEGAPRATSVGIRTTGLETENFVFANTTSLVPAVYAKNPTVEISVDDPTYEDWATKHEKLINILLAKRYSPGINIKNKTRRCVINATLTNLSYIELGYITRTESSEQTLKQINDLAAEYAKDETTPKRLKEIEGELRALEEQVDFLRPSGPWAKFRSPRDVIIDPDSIDIDEANWIMIRDYMDTSYLNARYSKKDSSGEYVSVYKPTHVMKGTNKAETDMNSLQDFSMIKYTSDEDYSSYGFTDKSTFKRAQRTEVVYVWDKTTRRVYLFIVNDWAWPVWVWEDPYGFPDFFPVEELQFYMDPEEYLGRSEVSYYLDQQDGINEINNEIAKTRKMISGKYIYNKALFPDSDKLIEAFLSGTADKRVLGVKATTDTDLNKIFVPFKPPSAEAMQSIIFDKGRLIEAIDRVSSVTNVMRGVEYKTNTTNKAIESYESTTQTRLDEKIDAVEDFIGRIGYKLGHLCLKHMDKEQAVKILGEAAGNEWHSMRPEIYQYNSFFSITTVGGSTLKPTSATKKQQAIQIAQSLGQFANGSPYAVIVMLKVLQRAFDEVIITKEDWESISASIEAQMQKGGPQQGEGGQDPTQILEQIAMKLDGMPPEAKQQVAAMFAKGVPFKNIISMLTQQQ